MRGKKSLISVFFSTSGFKCIDFLESNQRVNAQYCILRYADILESLEGKPFYLHLDNAPAHYATKAKKWLEEHNVTILKHPPYSPDLAPCDFWLLGYLKGMLKGKSFCTSKELQDDVKVVLLNLKAKIFRTVLNEWIRRLKECIARRGDYIEIHQ